MTTSSIILSVINIVLVIVLVITTIFYAIKTAQMVTLMKKSFYIEHKGIIVFDDLSVDIIKDNGHKKTGIQVKCIFTNYGKVPTTLNVDSFECNFNNVIPSNKWKEFNTVLAPMQKITIFSPVVFFDDTQYSTFSSPLSGNSKISYTMVDDIGNKERKSTNIIIQFFNDNKFQTRWFFDNS